MQICRFRLPPDSNKTEYSRQKKRKALIPRWELQDLSVDERDPYILRAIGVRRIRRKSGGGEDVEETLQLKCKFLLKDSPAISGAER